MHHHHNHVHQRKAHAPHKHLPLQYHLHNSNWHLAHFQLDSLPRHTPFPVIARVKFKPNLFPSNPLPLTNYPTPENNPFSPTEISVALGDMLSSVLPHQMAIWPIR
jgi:hypothetical protein